MKFHKLKIVLTALIGFSTVMGVWNIYQAFADPESLIDYKIVSQPNQLYIEPGEIKDIKIVIRNSSAAEIWDSKILRLGTIFTNNFTDRPSIWGMDGDNILPGWLSENRIAPAHDKDVDLFMTAEFYFLIKAPDKTGNYRETFRPVLEHEHWLTGNPIIINIQVGNIPEIEVQAAQAKEIVIYRHSQTGELKENGVVVATLPVSSGKSGYTTPAGNYTIMNHIKDAYSVEYELWMPNWMGLKNVRYGFLGYGIHGLPYWRINPNSPKFAGKDGQIFAGGRLYENNRLYEGYSHLGTPVSHGCVRFGIHESDALYAWADTGIPVTII
ncbi:hypothetical protein DRH29_01015 [candidate division Kazan bacterium]|uniref:L,D-TPase catalytic domain-containing protein n=1 Tax=candidate division Kazan bacterium TaxID=2202143 RepID=A0A420ZDM8_UNCK3|nr:MAG: hypothetical protein DRH29_01015 [candidate division Kazan bacterium]